MSKSFSESIFSLYLTSLMSSEAKTEDRVAFSFADDQENKKMLTWQGMYIFRTLFFCKKLTVGVNPARCIVAGEQYWLTLSSDIIRKE